MDDLIFFSTDKIGCVKPCRFFPPLGNYAACFAINDYVVFLWKKNKHPHQFQYVWLSSLHRKALHRCKILMSWLEQMCATTLGDDSWSKKTSSQNQQSKLSIIYCLRLNIIGALHIRLNLTGEITFEWTLSQHRILMRKRSYYAISGSYLGSSIIGLHTLLFNKLFFSHMDRCCSISVHIASWTLHFRYRVSHLASVQSLARAAQVHYLTAEYSQSGAV